MVHKIAKNPFNALSNQEMEDLWESMSILLIRNTAKNKELPTHMQKTLNDIAFEGYARRRREEVKEKP